MIYCKKNLRRAWALTMCLLIAVPLLISPISVTAQTEISYTGVDYSTSLTLDTPVTGSTSTAGEQLYTEYAWFYLDKGYTINLTAGETYVFSYTVTMENQEANYLVPAIAILTGGAFAGSDHYYNGDCLAHAEDFSGDSTDTISLYFVPKTTGNYRVLTGCYIYSDSQEAGVDTELLVTVSPVKSTEPDWFAELADENLGNETDKNSFYTTSAPDGTLYAICMTDPYSNEEYVPYLYVGSYRLFAFSPDGEKLWSYDLPMPSYTQPLVGPDGTIYVATANGVSDESEVDYEGVYGSSYIVALNPDGSEKWVKEFKAGYVDEEPVAYEFYGQMALSKSGVLVLTAYNYYSEMGAAIMMAVDVNNDGEVLWEIVGDGENIYFPSYHTWSSPVIYEDTIFTTIHAYAYGFHGVAAFRLSDGEELWRVEVDDCCGPADCNISVDRDGTIYLVGDGEINIDGKDYNCPVYAIDLEGNVKWVKDIGIKDEDSFQTAVSGDYLYVGAGSAVYILDKSSDELVRQFDGLGKWLVSLVVLGDGSIGALYSQGLEEDSNYLFNRFSSGGDITEIFIIRHPDNQYGISLPTVTKDGYFAISVACTLYCFDLEATLADGWTINAANSAYTNSLARNAVTFVSNGGSSVEEQKVWTGSMATQPTPPTRPSETISGTTTRVYTFNGWYIDQACTIPFDFSTPIIGDITLYAGWLYEDQTAGPDDTSEPTDSSKPTDTDSPDTGDAGNLIIWSALCMASLGLLGTWVSIRAKAKSRD